MNKLYKLLNMDSKEININPSYNNEILKLINLIKKYNLLTEHKYTNLEDLCLETCKIENINYNIINYIFKNIKISSKNSSQYFDILLLNLKNSNEKTLENNLKNIKHLVSVKDRLNEIKDVIDVLSNKFIDKKESVSLLKSYNIYINKYFINKDNNINKKINSMIISIINTDNKTRILFYVKKIKKYIKFNLYIIDKKNIIDNLNNLINLKYLQQNQNQNQKQNTPLSILIFLKLINFLKKNNHKSNDKNNNFETILARINKNIYDYVYFFKNNNNLLIEKDSSLNFISHLGFIKKEYKEIENLNLKRGFIQGLLKDNKKYLLKFQPNKSFMELVINFYIKSLQLEKTSNPFLLPEYFFINEDNSYFYIIEKYDSDLYKFFNKLDENIKNFDLPNILKIIFFIINSIKILHDNNIIHSDLKLENIVLNYDNLYQITDIKIIDFDVSLFDKIPNYLKNLPEPFDKILNNKKPRGTRIYMIKNELMSFKNDIYSLGIIIIMLLYKTIKLDISNNKKKLKEDEIKNKKEIIKQNGIIKKLSLLKDNIEKKESKIKLIDNVINYFKKKEQSTELKSKSTNLIKINYLKDLIHNCINTNKNINELLQIYSEKLFDKPFSNILE